MASPILTSAYGYILDGFAGTQVGEPWRAIDKRLQIALGARHRIVLEHRAARIHDGDDDRGQRLIKCDGSGHCPRAGGRAHGLTPLRCWPSGYGQGDDNGHDLWPCLLRLRRDWWATVRDRLLDKAYDGLVAAMLLGLVNLALFALTRNDAAALRFLCAGLLLLSAGIGSVLALCGTNLPSKLIGRLPFWLQPACFSLK